MLVTELLQSNGIPFQVKGRDVLIRCLNPDHPDRNPSLAIDRHSGVGHCFSCGFKLNIYKYFGAPNDPTAALAQKLRERITAIVSQTHGLRIPGGAVPYEREFKGISKATLRAFSAFTHRDYENRVMIPLKDSTGKIVAFSGRAIDFATQPKYKIFPGGVEAPFFPGKLKPSAGHLVLVEGLYDALSLIQNGISCATATLGTQTLGGGKGGLNKEKVRQLKLSGVSVIHLVFDGDDAGRKASEMLKPMLESVGFIVYDYEMPEDSDPNTLTLEQLEMLKKVLENNGCKIL